MCVTEHTYNSGDICTVGVTFSPLYPGMKSGAVVLTGSSGNTLATAYVRGMGTGPQIVFPQNNVQTILGGSYDYPLSIALDGSANVFLAEPENADVKEIRSSGGYASDQTLGGGYSFIQPAGVAVDGVGNVIVADYGNSQVDVILAKGGYTTVNVLAGYPTFNAPNGVAVDASGNIFVSDQVNNALYEMTAASGYTTVNTLATGFSNPNGVAVDGNGNVYVADNGHNAVKEVMAVAGVVPPSPAILSLGGGFSSPNAVAVDASGAVFVADSGNSAVKTMPAGCLSASCVSTLGSGFTSPFGVALSGNGNLFLVDYLSGLATELNFSGTPSLTFANTGVGVTSSAQAISIANDGNAALNFTPAGLAAPMDYLQVAGSGTPVDCADSSSVASGASCNLSIAFMPLSTGPHGESFLLTNNDLNATGATQSIALSGTGTAPADTTATALAAMPATVSFGQTVTLTATVTDTTHSGTTPAGTVTFTDTVASTTTTVASNVTVVGGVASHSYTPSGIGAHSVTASYTPSEGFATSSGMSGYTLDKATPMINWPTPSPIVQGTALSSTQLDATSSTPGTFVYTPVAGVVPAAGVATLSVTFTPTDTVDFNTATTTVSLIVGPAPQNFGSVPVGEASPVTVTFPFASAVTLGNPAVQVVTQGAASLDFTNAGSGTCTNGNPLDAGATCTVSVTFTPKYPGTRYGAVVLYNAAGDVIATEYLSGVGTGGLINFPPGVPVEVASPDSQANPNDVYDAVVDASGNVYVVANVDNAVYKETLSAGNYVQSTVATGLSNPEAVAIDGAGNVYIADSGNNRILEETWQNGSWGQTAIASVNFPAGVAVDAQGNVYVSSFSDSAVYVLALSNGVDAAPSLVDNGLSSPRKIAVDGSGDVFVADTGNQRVVEDIPNGESYTQTPVGSGMHYPYGVSVGAAGRVYVADTINHRILLETPSGASYTQTLLIGGPTAYSIQVDGRQPLPTDTTSSAVFKIDVYDPPSLSFAPIKIGASTPDSPQSVEVENNGNASLTFAVPGAGTNPVLSAGFAFNGTTSCPEIAQSGSAVTLVVNATCVYSVDFTPPSVGSYSGSLAITDNSNNVPGATQSVSLSGTALPPDSTSTAVTTAPSAIVLGGSSILSATVTDTSVTPNAARTNRSVPNNSSLTTPTGTVTFTDTTGGVTTTVAGNAALVNGVATVASPYAATPIGLHIITATYTPTGSFLGSTGTGNLLVEPVPVTFPTSPVGTVTSAMTVTIPVASAVTLGNPGVMVVTQGATGLDFGNAGTGTCTNGMALAAGGTCTVAVTFTPTYPGPRNGAVLLEDASGNVLATVYLHGVGTGAQALFPPGVQTTPVGGQAHWPEAVAVDAQFNLFFVDGNSNSGGGAILELPWTGSSYGTALAPASLNLPGSGYYPTGALAVDGAGNLYTGVSSDTAASVLKYPWNGSSYGTPVWLGTGLGYPLGVAVDGSGNLFIADPGIQQILEIPWDGGSASSGYGTQVTIAGSAALGGDEGQYPVAIAVDNSENLFYIGQTSGTTAALEEIPFSGASYSASFVPIDSSLYDPYGVVVDPNGNLYVGDTNGSGTSTPVYEYVLTVDGYAPRAQRFTTPNGGGPIALDSAGSLYVNWNSGDSLGAIYKQDRSAPPTVVFAHPTVIGSPDGTDNPQSLLLLNYGNANLTFASSSLSANPSLSSGAFSLDASTTCPKLAAGAPAANVNANTTCLYQVDFTPDALGANNTILTLTDNSLNAAGATQSVALSGTATAAPVTATPSVVSVALTQNHITSSFIPVTGPAATERLPIAFLSFADRTATLSVYGCHDRNSDSGELDEDLHGYSHRFGFDHGFSNLQPYGECSRRDLDGHRFHFVDRQSRSGIFHSSHCFRWYGRIDLERFAHASHRLELLRIDWRSRRNAHDDQCGNDLHRHRNRRQRRDRVVCLQPYRERFRYGYNGRSLCGSDAESRSHSLRPGNCLRRHEPAHLQRFACSACKLDFLHFNRSG